MNKHVKFIAITVGYLALCYLIGFDWLYFGVLAIADFFYWKNVNWAFWKKREKKTEEKQGFFKEFGNALVFAVIGASLIHMFVIQPFTIPTSSMEGSMLVGDYLFVSKLHYGPYVPNTPVSLPFMHNTVWGTKDVKPYSESVQLGYHRMPGFTTVKNNDIVVFNYPEDNLYKTMPFDKKTHYVKRCLGIAGDKFQITDKVVYVNDKKLKVTDRTVLQFEYLVGAKRQFKAIKDGPGPNDYHFPSLYKMGIADVHIEKVDKAKNIIYYSMMLSEETKKELSKVSFVESIESMPLKYNAKGKNVYPRGVDNGWDIDNFGPIIIPAKGMTVELTRDNYNLYSKIIRKYEGHQIKWDNNQAIIDGEIAKEYTFIYDYYWMMGDNRHNSLDSRFWGFVPETHIVGKPVFKWFSKDYNGNVRWDRLFTVIHGEGKAKSYLVYFLIGFVVVQGMSYYRKKKSKSA